MLTLRIVDQARVVHEPLVVLLPALPAPAEGAALVSEDSAPVNDDAVRLTVWVRGKVQGVGFRWWVRVRALELGLVGSATNLDDGRVLVVAEGPRPACAQLLGLLTGEPSRGRPGVVSGTVERWSQAGQAQPLRGFLEL